MQEQLARLLHLLEVSSEQLARRDELDKVGPGKTAEDVAAPYQKMWMQLEIDVPQERAAQRPEGPHRQAVLRVGLAAADALCGQMMHTLDLLPQNL